MKVLFRDAIVAAKVAFRLVPEVLNSIDMIVLVSKQLGVVDAVVMEL